MLHVDRKQSRHCHPAQACKQRPGQAFKKAVVPSGQIHKSRRKQQCLHRHQQKIPQPQQIFPQPGKLTAPVPEELSHGTAEHMKDQCQQQHQQKGNHIRCAQQPGAEPAPVFRHTVDGIEALRETVDPLPCRPQCCQGGQRNHRAGGVHIGARNQIPGITLKGRRKKPLYQVQKIFRLEPGIAEQSQHQHQRRKHRKHDKIAGIA